MKKIVLLAGAVLTGIVASSCCILPLLLGAASAGTAGLGAAIAPYRPYLTALTVLLLGAAFYFTYRREKACGKTGCCEPISSARTGRTSKVLLWIVTLFTLAAVAYPNIVAYRMRVLAPSGPSTAVPGQAQTAVFVIPSMDCPQCAANIADTLRKTPGVYDAKVDFATKQATVSYDGARISLGQLRDAINRTGFPATDAERFRDQTKHIGDACCPAPK